MTKTIIITAALTALALSAIASKAAITYKPQQTAAVTTCQTQIWPNFSDDCLLTISGEKSERKFRIVTF